MEKSFMFNFLSKSATSINHTFIQIQGAKKSNFFNATLLSPYSLNPHHSLTGIRTKLKLFKKISHSLKSCLGILQNTPVLRRRSQNPSCKVFRYRRRHERFVNHVV